MKIHVPYGKSGSLDIEVDDGRVVGLVQPNPVACRDEADAIRDGLDNPIRSPAFREFLGGARDVLFLINDPTRPTPTARVLDVLYEDIKGLDATFLVATGAHRPPTEEEYGQIFGRHCRVFRDRTRAHDPRRDEAMVYLGRSQHGTEVLVNRLAVEAHKIVVIGSVEPHYFAGYTGGRKSFLPGIASYRTIEQNHKLALDPRAKTLALEGNPVHEDMIDAVSMVKKEIFSIQTVLDRHHCVYAVTAGHIHDSFLAAVGRANEVFAVPIEEKADIVVSVVKAPGDIDLYQSQKGIDNAKLALKDRGILILVSRCGAGLGDESFARILSSCATPRESLERIREKFVLGYHKAAKMAEVSLWAETWGVTGLDPRLLRSIFIKPCRSLQGAVDDALQQKGPGARVLFLMDGGLTVPLVR